MDLCTFVPYGEVDVLQRVKDIPLETSSMEFLGGKNHLEGDKYRRCGFEARIWWLANACPA